MLILKESGGIDVKARVQRMVEEEGKEREREARGLASEDCHQWRSARPGGGMGDGDQPNLENICEEIGQGWEN